MRTTLFALSIAAFMMTVQAFVPSHNRVNLVSKVTSSPFPISTILMSCRRNNKTEKRKRNREYARKFASKTGGSRRSSVIEEKRLVVAESETKFQAQVFGMTTDDDMPAYSGFDFI
mmetsp:Transcript_3322/g.3472  ORF Transcript_3322/g.3472 Transcript_3322/m.3472 type:complete len:116 (+) Transcript_3322:43-390(+)